MMWNGPHNQAEECQLLQNEVLVLAMEDQLDTV